MARWIKSDGTGQEVCSRGSHGFTDAELCKLVGGSLGEYALLVPSRGGLYLFINYGGFANGKPYNSVATELLHEYRKSFAYVKVYGDAVVVRANELAE